jgi:ABC-type sulfate transport system permease component
MTVPLSPLIISLKVAFFATAFALVAGVAAAFMLVRVKLPGRELLDAFLTLPLVLPPTIIGYYLIVAIGKNGVTHDPADIDAFPGAVVNYKDPAGERQTVLLFRTRKKSTPKKRLLKTLIRGL